MGHPETAPFLAPDLSCYENENMESAMPMKDGIVRRTDAIYIYRAGKPTKVEAKTTAAEGFTVDPNGSVMWTNGKKVMLTEGQMVGFDGTLLKEPIVADPDRNAVQGSSGARE